MLSAPPWYTATNNFLLTKGWPVLLLGSGIVIGITLYLIAKRQAAPLALWLTYLFMP